MLVFILRRLALMVPTTLGIALVIFSLFHLAPGDPALIAAGDQSNASMGQGGDGEARIDKFRRENGLDRSFVVQFLDYVGPLNFNPDGHPWLSSPRSERVVNDVEVPQGIGAGEPRTVAEGRPVAIEHLFASSADERQRLDDWVGTMQNASLPAEQRDAAQTELVSFGEESEASRNKALARIFQCLFEQRLAGPTEVEVIGRVDAVLSAITGHELVLEPALVERDGERHRLKRWFAWYFTEGGAAHTQNTGLKPYGGLLSGDLGKEYQSKQSVSAEIAKCLKVTVPLALVSTILAYILALPLGIFSVRRQGTALDGGLTVGLFILYSVPRFWAGLMLVLVFGATGLDLLPVVGLYSKDFDSMSALGKAWDVVLHSILPVVTLTYGSLAYLSRQMRAGMLDVIRQDYIRTARAKGLSDDKVIYKHALRNSMIPVLTLLASILPILVGGALIVEVIFDIPGMGKYAYEGLLKRDFNVIMATTLFVGIMTQFGILLSDIAYSLVDPRIRLS